MSCTGGDGDGGGLDAAPAALARKLLEEEDRQASAAWTEAEGALNRALKEATKKKSRGGGSAGDIGPGGRLPRTVPRYLGVPSVADPSSASSVRAEEDDDDRRRRQKPAVVHCCRKNSPAASEGEEGEQQQPLPRIIDDAEAADRCRLRDERIAEARERAPEHRARLMCRRSQEAKGRMAGQKRRKLHAKIAIILEDVHRRQGLEVQQRRARRFREQREKMGFGPCSSVGDADAHALGLIGHRGKITKEHVETGASPRRTQILQGLSLSELDLLRRDPWYYFDELPSVASTQLTNAGGSIDSLAAPDSSMSALVEQLAPTDSLIEFFTLQRGDRDLPVEDFAKRLWSRLDADAAEVAWLQLPDKQQSEVDSESKFLYGGGSVSSWNGSDRMPCLAGKQPLRVDDRSPTLKKVRVVHERRETQDSKLLEQQREKLERRANISAYKAKEQQRELQFNALLQKQQHQARVMEVEQRRLDLESEMQEQVERLEMDLDAKLHLATEMSDHSIEMRRSKASTTLDHWYDGVARSEKYLREVEQRRVAYSERNWSQYLNRLWTVGASRHNATESDAQKSSTLRFRLHASASQQIAAKDAERARETQEAMEARLAAASERRRCGPLATSRRYRFVERALEGKRSVFDSKMTPSHDRRCRVEKGQVVSDEGVQLMSVLSRSSSAPNAVGAA